jgi:hypothetical protein
VADITSLLRQRHRIREGELPDFRIMLMSEMMSDRERDDEDDDVAPDGGRGDLHAGGRHRDHEHHAGLGGGAHAGIGLRMAIGARQQDILLQFLMEAVVLAIIAGLIGMALGGELRAA